MDVKEKLLGSIEVFLADYAGWIRRAKGSRSDAAEEFYRELLNLAFGYHLKNMNREKGNYPGIDLADDAAGIAVQVTSTETAQKVRDTLKEFLDKKYGLFGRYSRLIILVAGDAKSKTGIYETHGFDFKPRRDIWDTAGLLAELQPLPQEKLEEVEAFLRKRTSRLPKGNPVLQLPAPEWRTSVEFLGRKEELAWIEAELCSGTKPVVIAGLGGIGKTALTIKFRRRWEGHVYFATFRESFTRTLAESVGMAIPVQERQGLNEVQTASLALEYLSRCEEGDLLIVDNAEVTGAKWSDLTKDPFYQELRRLPMAVLMTTRHRDTGGRWLGRLAQDDLREIFRRHEVKLSVDEMDRLIDAVDGHTMTVDMIARTIRESWGDVTAEDILAAMANSTLHEGDFDEIETDHESEQRQIYAHLRALFDLSGIREDGRYALRCATLLPQTGMDEALFRHALTDGAAKEIKLLEKKGWVDRKEGLVTIHPVVRLVCRTELKPTEENCGDFLFGIKRQYDRNHYDHVKFRQMADMFEKAADTLEDETGIWAGEAGYFWNKVAEHRRELKCKLRTVEKREKKQPGTNELAVAYNNVGSTYGTLGEHKRALEYKLKALKIREQVLQEDHPSIAASYNNVGTSYGELGNHKKALEFKLKALEIRKRILEENHPDLAISYNNVGISYGALNDHEKSLTYKLTALRIRKEALGENHPDVAASYNNIGYTYGQMGNHAARLEHYLKALTIREEVLPGNHPDIATSCSNVAWTYHNLGQIDQAAVYMRRAADVINRSTLPEQHRKRVKYNEWAEQMEHKAQQAQAAK